VNKYLELLPIVADRGWQLIGDRIRDREKRCPLCALVHELSAGEISARELVYVAFARIGLRADNDSNEIIDAADCDGSLMRDDLMDALGMRP
jgi:hypothetical protein